MTPEQENSLKGLGVDLDVVLERFVENEALYFKCCSKFLVDSNYENFIKSLPNNNPEETFDYVHSLKGVCANLGFDKLYKPVAEIVEVFRAGSMDYDKDNLEEVKREYLTVRETLEKIL